MPLSPQFVYLHAMTNSKILKLARQSRLIDTCFKAFMKARQPEAEPELRAKLRAAFFSGAFEFFQTVTFGAALEDDVSEADLDFMASVVSEVEAAVATMAIAPEDLAAINVEGGPHSDTHPMAVRIIQLVTSQGGAPSAQLASITIAYPSLTRRLGMSDPDAVRAVMVLAQSNPDGNTTPTQH